MPLHGVKQDWGMHLLGQTLGQHELSFPTVTNYLGILNNLFEASIYFINMDTGTY